MNLRLPRTLSAALFCIGWMMVFALAEARASIWVQPVIEDSPMIAKGHLEGGVNGEGSPRPDGKTPLVLAIDAGQSDVVSYLLNHGADPDLKDSSGKTALQGDHIAKRSNLNAASLVAGYIAQHPGMVKYYGKDKPVLKIVNGESQVGAPDQGGPESLSVLVSDSNGEPLVDAPVKFAVEGGGQNLLTEASSPDSATLLMRTGSDGVATANVHIPKKPGERITITATAGPSGKEAVVKFSAMAADDEHPSEGDSVFNPTDETALLNPDGSIDVTWVNHTQDETGFKVWVRVPGAWKLGVSAPPHSTKAHIQPP
jgi:hypothetical protein